MSDKNLPSRPNLHHYKKQAKQLLAAATAGSLEAINRIIRHHPRFHLLGSADAVKLSHAQFVIAREHGFENWPKFAEYIRMLTLVESVSTLSDPVSAFLEVACVPRHSSHASGALDHAQLILDRYPDVARTNIFTAAVLADVELARRFVASD
ncbi:MAG: hypothetical protein ACJ74Y_16015, partial [Bryobacteraceae bacterium]